MTVRDLCDIAHAILLGRLERAALAERQVAALLHGQVTHGQTFNAAAIEFEVALAAPPEPESETDRLRRELGV